MAGWQLRSIRLVVLPLVVSGALLLSGCGGGEQQEPPEDVAAPQGIMQHVTAEPDATDTPEPTAAPTDEPTAVPPTEEPPTDPPPTDTPLPPTDVPPTAVPAPAHDPDPDQDQNCDDFPTIDDAVYWWNFHRTAERPNPGRLDGDGDGEICEAGTSGDAAAPPPPPEPPPLAFDCSYYHKCDTFGTQAEAQAWWEACGRPSKMDADGDGVVCEGLP